MARPPRLDIVFQRHADPVWFLTLTTARSEPWLSDAVVHDALQDFAERGLEAGRAAIGRYVLMPDHLHLFVRLAPEEVLGAWVKALKAVLSRSTGRKTAQWQDGFFDHLLRQSESYAQKWDYVQQNPVRAGLVRQVNDWPFQGEIFPLSFE